MTINVFNRGWKLKNIQVCCNEPTSALYVSVYGKTTKLGGVLRIPRRICLKCEKLYQEHNIRSAQAREELRKELSKLKGDKK